MSRNNNIITPLLNNLDSNYDFSFNYIHPNYEEELFINMLANVMLDAQIPLNEPHETRNTLNQSLNDRNPIKFVISENEKNKLLPVKFKDVQCKNENTKCSITQEEFNDNDEVIQLPCNHCFTEEAIMNWLTKEKGECPVCRYKFECVEIRDEVQNESESNIQMPHPYRNELNYYNSFFMLPNHLMNEPRRRVSGESYFNFFQMENFIFNEEDDNNEDDENQLD